MTSPFPFQDERVATIIIRFCTNALVGVLNQNETAHFFKKITSISLAHFFFKNVVKNVKLTNVSIEDGTYEVFKTTTTTTTISAKCKLMTNAKACLMKYELTETTLHE